MESNEPRQPRVLFVSPPIQLPRVYAHYPMSSNLGMLYHAALLEREGMEVALLDAFFTGPHLNVRPIRGELRHVGAELGELRALLAAHRPDVVVIVLTMYSDVHRLNETYVGELAAMARELHPGAAILAADCYVCGINYLSYDPVRLLEQVPALDGVVVGEGDHRLAEAVRRAAARAPLEGLPQLAWRTPEGLRWDPTRAPALRALDDLPRPAFHLLDMDHYFSCLADAIRQDLVHEYHEPERILPLMTSRGCNFSCSFCTQQVLGMPWRAYSVACLRETILFFRERYRVERFFFLDNNINVNARRFAELASFLAEEGIPWDAVNGFRADYLDREALGLIRAAGNRKVTVSAESGDPRVVKGIIGKRLDLKAVVNVVRTAQELELPSQVHYIIGIPGETRQDMNRTLEFALALYEEHAAWPLLQHSIPFRGTDLYRSCEVNGWFSEHPDAIPGWDLEERCVIETPEFSSAQVMRMKRNFTHLLDAMDTVAVAEPGVGCNNRCLACEECSGQPGDPLPLLARRRERGARDLLIAGPEPTLLGRRLPELVAGARDLGFQRITLATNGRMLAYPSLVRALVAAGLTHAVVRLEGGTAAVHDRLTRVPGSFDQTIAGLRRLRAAGIGVDTALRCTRPALDGLEGALGLLARLGVTATHLRIPAPVGGTTDHPELVVPFPALLPRLVEALRARRDMDVDVQGLPFCLLPPDLADRARPLPFWRFPLYRRQKAKWEVCKGCTEYIPCLGFWREEHEGLYRQREALGLPDPAPGDG